VWRRIQDELAAAGVAAEPVRLDGGALAKVLAVVARDLRKVNELGGYLHLVISIPSLAAR